MRSRFQVTRVHPVEPANTSPATEALASTVSGALAQRMRAFCGKSRAVRCARRANPCTCCPPRSGQYQPSAGRWRCVACEAGKFQPQPGHGSCNLCARGRHQPNTRQRECIDCAAGKVQPDTGGSSCIACVKGKHQTQIAQAACPVCGAGKYADSPGTVHCTECTAIHTPAPRIEHAAGTGVTWIRDPGLRVDVRADSGRLSALSVSLDEIPFCMGFCMGAQGA